MLPRDKEKLQMKADVFKAIGHPARLGILELLRLGEMPVGLIASKLGADVGGVSKHLSLLRKQGIVADRKEGLKIFYKILRFPIHLTCLDVWTAWFAKD